MDFSEQFRRIYVYLDRLDKSPDLEVQWIVERLRQQVNILADGNGYDVDDEEDDEASDFDVLRDRYNRGEVSEAEYREAERRHMCRDDSDDEPKADSLHPQGF